MIFRGWGSGPPSPSGSAHAIVHTEGINEPEEVILVLTYSVTTSIFNFEVGDDTDYIFGKPHLINGHEFMTMCV